MLVVEIVRFAFSTATVILAWDDGWPALVAMTVTVAGTPTTGAVKRPLAEMLPELADQVTAVLLVSLTVAVNWICPPGATVELLAEIVTLMQELQGSTAIM